ncbi:hypothetical protein S245_066925, partial [Arachis hypogaea]
SNTSCSILYKPTPKDLSPWFDMDFYFQHGHPPPNELKEQCMLRIDQLFHDHLDGVQMHEFKLLTKEVCKLPSFFSTSLFRKIENGAGVVTRC